MLYELVAFFKQRMQEDKSLITLLDISAQSLKINREKYHTHRTI